MCAYNLLFSGPKFPHFLLNVEKVVVDYLLFRFFISKKFKRLMLPTQKINNAHGAQVNVFARWRC